MSALRISVPGQPVRFVDLGYDRGRITGYVSANVSLDRSVGGPVVPDASRQAKAALHARVIRSLGSEPCGMSMPKGGICIEMRGHKSHCRAVRG